MRTPRDSKRCKVYAAEHGADLKLGRIFKSEKQEQRYVDRLCEDLSVAPVKVEWGRSRNHSQASSERRLVRIADCGWHKSELVLLHELAHIFQPPATAFHGEEFLMVYARLIAWKLGQREAKKFLIALSAEGV